MPGKPTPDKPTYQQLEQRIHQLERQLSQTREEHDLIRNHSPAGIYEIDFAGQRFVTVNEAICDLTGYTKEEILATEPLQLLKGDSRVQFSERMAQLAQGQAIPTMVEYEINTKTGEPLWLILNARMLEKNGAVVGAQVVAHDITRRKTAQLQVEETQRLLEQRIDERSRELTAANRKLTEEIAERRRIEAQLKEQSEFLEVIVNRASDGIFVVDDKHRYALMNPACYQMAGFGPDDWQDKSAGEAIDVVNHEDARRAYDAVRQGNSQRGEFQIKAADGQIRSVLSTMEPLHWKGKAHILGVLTDITELKKAENARKDTEEKYRLVVDNADYGIFVAQDNEIKFANAQTARFISYSLDELQSTPFARIIRSSATGGSHQGDGNHSAEEPQGTTTFRVYTKTAEEIWVEINSVQVMWEGRLATLNFIRDVTEQKQLQSQFRQSQKMQALGTLAGGIAHDFNNLLVPILGFSELALDDVAEGSVLHGNIKEVRRAANRAKQLVQQILTFSRKREHERQPLEIDGVVKESLKLLRATLPSTIEIRTQINSETGVVLADLSQIQQLVMNLCTNSFYAMRQQGGVLDVELRQVTIEQNSSRQPDLEPGQYLQLIVTDNGPGMSPRVLDRIFEPYFTTKPKGEGTGLGLAVVHGIVKSYGGDVVATSALNSGTKVVVLLPCLQRSAITDEHQLAEVPTGGEHILFVDDEPQVVQLAEQLLSRLGYRVTSLANGIQALEIFKSDIQAFDLVMTDMTMPRFTGKELARELLTIRPELPIILCTGYSEGISREEAHAMGICDLVLKPFIKSEVAEKIRAALDR